MHSSAKREQRGGSSPQEADSNSDGRETGSINSSNSRGAGSSSNDDRQQTVTILIAVLTRSQQVGLPVCLLEGGLEARRPDCQKEGELTVCMINAYTHRLDSGSSAQRRRTTEALQRVGRLNGMRS